MGACATIEQAEMVWPKVGVKVILNGQTMVMMAMLSEVPFTQQALRPRVASILAMRRASIHAQTHLRRPTLGLSVVLFLTS